MNEGLKELSLKRQKIVDAHRENDSEEGLKRLLTDLYPDNAHFIYELLQNAEDAGATEVKFTLDEKGLDFEHNGSRLFTVGDVNAITSIGDKSKKDDPTKIGEFGVGFKAVFAYTNTPEIHSGEFHFQIQDLFVPKPKKIQNEILKNGQTLFLFPFNNPSKKPETAIEEIEYVFRNMGENTLLFLNNIRSIEYMLSDGSLGYLKRIEKNNGIVEINGSSLQGKDIVSHWLRFQKEVNVLDEDNNNKSCRIAIAYHLVANDNKSKLKWKMEPFDNGQVSIYFPAEKETSNLRFHIHAPFASTVARDSVRDCNANRQLRDELGKLIVESLFEIRDKGLLDIDFLATIPNSDDKLSSFYNPFRDVIIGAFKTQEITPTKNRKYAAADNLYHCPAAISEVLCDNDMAFLLDRSVPVWVANAPQKNQRADRFLNSLNIEEWGWYELTSEFNWLWNDRKKKIEHWISKKTDSWLMQFYALLEDAYSNAYGHPRMQDLQIVRITSVEKKKHVVPKKAFFLPKGRISHQKGIHFVSPSVYDTGKAKARKEKAKAFLHRIGVRPFDAKAIIELRLKKYDTGKLKEGAQHFKDIESFVKYFHENPDDVSLFSKHSFLRAYKGQEEKEWAQPDQIFLDEPYCKTGLRELSSIHQKMEIWEGYYDELSESIFENFYKFLKSIGVFYKLQVEQTSTWQNPNKSVLRKDWGRSTHTGIDQDYTINQLSQYLSVKTISASLLIWNALTEAKSKVSEARYRPNKQYPTREAKSQLIYHLKVNEWIPNKQGDFCMPGSVCKEDLHQDFQFDNRNGLLSEIGFGELVVINKNYNSKRNEEAQSLGFKSAKEAEEMAELCKKFDKTPDQIRQMLVDDRFKKFPSKKVHNPERRQEKIGEQFEESANIEYNKRRRSVRTTRNSIDPDIWLRNYYTNEDGEMICQICKHEMPFKKRDGNYYFEAVEVMSNGFISKEHEAKYLALCPVCAAMYKEFIKKDDNQLQTFIETLVESDEPEIPIQLGEIETSVRFVESHFIDIKTILEF